MDTSVLTLVGLAGIGAFLLTAIFVLPKRKAPEEKGKQPLYEERCSLYWKWFKGGMVAGGNIPIARISLYDSFFIVALIHPTKIPYSDISSVSLRKGWMSNSIIIQLVTGSSLHVHPRNVEKMLSLIKERSAK